jgi:hypothetical protein
MEAEKLTKREQIAKELLCAMLTGNATTQYSVIQQMAMAAVYAADALEEALAVKQEEVNLNE